MALNDYTRTEWVNGTAPAVNALNLNKIEEGIFDATEAVQVLEDNPYILPPATEARSKGQPRAREVHECRTIGKGSDWSPAEGAQGERSHQVDTGRSGEFSRQRKRAEDRTEQPR